MTDYGKAKAQLLKTVDWLKRINPSAAAWLREGLEETLTIHRSGHTEQLRKRMQGTNLIESTLSVTRSPTRRVKRWQHGDMRMRWAASGLLAAENRFHRIRGYRMMLKLLTALVNCKSLLAKQPKAA